MSMRYLLILVILALSQVGLADTILQIKANDHPAQQHLSYRAITVENISEQPQIIQDIIATVAPEKLQPLLQFCDQNSTCEKIYLNTCRSGIRLMPHQQCMIWLRAVAQDLLLPNTEGQLQLQVTIQNQLVASAATTFALNYSQEVYAGGSFSAPSMNLARWDGAQWHSLGKGLIGGGEVMQLASYQGDLYATGSFYQAGDKPVNFIARWDGSAWHDLGLGIGDPGGDALLSYKNELLVGGGFDYAGEQPANYLAKWDGTDWFGFELGLDAPINTLVADADQLYIGGEFTQLGNQRVDHLAVQKNGTWQALEQGVNASVYALALEQKNALYVGGSFTQAGDVSAAHLARWKNNSWSALGTGVNDNVLTLVTDHDQVFAGGAFTQAGDVPVNFVAQWNGKKWLALEGGVTFAKQPKYTQVYALTAHGQQLYVGGYFTQAHNKNGTINANYIAIWDRNQMQWQTLGEGVNGIVRSITIIPALKITNA
jgi:hypothetical protein